MGVTKVILKKAGGVLIARSAKDVVANMTKPTRSCATIVTSHTTSTAPTHHWTMYLMEPGNARRAHCVSIVEKTLQASTPVGSTAIPLVDHATVFNNARSARRATRMES